MKNKWSTQLPTLVVVAQSDVIQLYKTTPQTPAAFPAFGMCAGSDGPWLLLQVKWVVVAVECITLNNVNLGPRVW